MITPLTYLTSSSNDSAYHPRTNLTFSISLRPSGSSFRSRTRCDSRMASSSRRNAATYTTRSLSSELYASGRDSCYLPALRRVP